MTDTTSPLGTDGDPILILPDRIGPYRILGLLGEGGMGRVYLARETNPPREVALKVVRGLAGHARQRFRREVELLAQMEHPGIARIYAAGEDVIAGLPMPWLALELVRGPDLRTWIERNRPDQNTRLKLLLAICQAVQHAHERGVIHRDLKPGNILIGADGQPKVLDFGVARLHDDPKHMTQAGQVIGTVPYMSPEQLSGQVDAIDARSDVYALGVIAYELFSGRLPHPALSTSSLFEALDIVCHEQPPRLQHITPAAQGDLDRVVMKALAQEASRRYATAGEFAAYLLRLLEHRPVQARAPTLAYRASRFVRRHRALSTAAAIVFLALVAATTVSTLAAQRARTALAEAQSRAAELTAVNTFVEQMLTQADPELGGSPDMPLRQVLEAAGQTLESETIPPRTAGQVATLLGRTWSGLGETTVAQAFFDRGQNWLEQGFGNTSPEVADLRFSRIEDLLRSNQPDTAIDQALALEASLGQIDADWARAVTLRTQVVRAQALEETGEVEAAIALDRELLASPLLPTLEDATELTDVLRHNLAYALLHSNGFAEAEVLIRQVLESESSRLGPDHPQTLYTKKVLGQALHRQGHLDQAVNWYAQVYEARRERYGEDHPLTLGSGMQLAAAYNTLNRPTEAEPLLRHALEIRARRDESDGNDALVARVMLISSLDKLDRNDEALALADEVIAMEHGQANRDTLAARNARGMLLLKTGQVMAARDTFDQLLRLAPDILGPNAPTWPVMLVNAAKVDLAAGHIEAARDKLETALPLLESRQGPDHPRTREARDLLENIHTQPEAISPVP